MERDDPKNSVKCDTEWFLDLKTYCEEYEKESVPAEASIWKRQESF